MKSPKFFWLVAGILVFYISWKEKPPRSSSSIITIGQMPNLTADKAGNLHLVFGKGDSIMYMQSANQGETFSKPFLVSRLPELSAAAMRGPQIAFTDEGVTILASNGSGNIYSYWKGKSGNWVKGSRVNDMDTVAKEGFMALGGDGRNLFAVWLDLRGNRRNKIVGAKSINAGKTWSKNKLLYASPDSVVCECCKPSVAVKADNVYAMFRNNLHGNRDLYLIQSLDGGNNFGKAQKLGKVSWALNGCPMDGGGVAVILPSYRLPVGGSTVEISRCAPMQCDIGRTGVLSAQRCLAVGGEVVCVLPNGKKQNLGKGALPIIKAVNNKSIICIWENESKIYKAVLEL